MLALLKRILKTTFGLFIFAFGVYLCIQANIGLDPWSALSSGISGRVGLSYGTVAVITSVVILAIDVFLKEKIGFGTIIDALSVGFFIDIFMALGIVPFMNNFAAGVLVMLAGQIFVSVGSYFYIKPALGCGPRDSLMVAIGKRLKKAPIGLVRSLLEGTVLLIGWLLGAKVGIGTVISVFGIGVILQCTFRIFKFDVESVVHEDVVTSIKNVVNKTKEAERV